MPGRPGAIETIYPRNLMTGQLGDRPESARLGGDIVYYAPVPRRGKVSALMSSVIRGYGNITPNNVPIHIRRILVHLFHYLLGMFGLLPLPFLFREPPGGKGKLFGEDGQVDIRRGKQGVSRAGLA